MKKTQVSKAKPKPQTSARRSQDGEVLDFAQLMEIIDLSEISAIRRSLDKRGFGTRYSFGGILSVSCTIQIRGKTTQAIANLVNLSESGCRLEIPTDKKGSSLKAGARIDLKIYFRYMKEVVVPLTLTVRNAKIFHRENRSYVAYGCLLDHDSRGYRLYMNFVRFLESLDSFDQMPGSKVQAA